MIIIGIDPKVIGGVGRARPLHHSLWKASLCKMKLLPINTSPHVQVSFAEKSSEQYWKQRMAFSQKIVNLEVLLVAKGMREAATTLINPVHFLPHL